MLLLLNRPNSSWRDAKFRVAVERAAGDCHFNRASGRSCRNRGGDFGPGDDSERRSRAVKRDAGRARQIGP